MPCAAVGHHGSELLRGRRGGQRCGTPARDNGAEIHQCVANGGGAENRHRLSFLQTLGLQLRGNAVHQRRGLGPGQALFTVIQRDAIGLICSVGVNEPSQFAKRPLEVLQRLSSRR